MNVKKILIIGILLTIMTVMPVMAELNITHLDDGKTLFTSGLYWIKWDPIGNHVVGDQFFINATTNLSVGTGIGCQFFDPTIYCRTKNCLKQGSYTGEVIIVESGDSSGVNTVSFFVNTTGFQPETYFFEFRTFSSNIPAEIDSFDWDYIVNYNISLSPADGGSTIKPTPSPLSFIGICGAIFVSLYVFCLIQRKERQRRWK